MKIQNNSDYDQLIQHGEQNCSFNISPYRYTIIVFHKPRDGKNIRRSDKRGRSGLVPSNRNWFKQTKPKKQTTHIHITKIHFYETSFLKKKITTEMADRDRGIKVQPIPSQGSQGTAVIGNINSPSVVSLNSNRYVFYIVIN